MKRGVTTLWQALIDGRTGSLTRWTLNPLLTSLSSVHDWGHQLRLLAYRNRWATVKRLPCCVISVGNITLGGTGKTPMVEAIATLLQKHGIRVAILSRGYKGRRQEAITVVSDGIKCLVPPVVAGDEPALLAERLRGIPVLVARDRFAAGKLAVERFSVEAVVLDDGFQHVQLARDLNILLLDAARPFGNGRLFPRGELRERLSALARADMVVLTHWEPDLPKVPAALPRALPSVFCSRHEPYAARVLPDGPSMPLTALHGRRLVAFCGIGMPKDFHHTLQRLGAVVVAFHPFPDHHDYTPREVESLSHKARQHGAEALVTTEKDGMRLRRLGALPWPVWAVQVQCSIVTDRATWEACVLGAVGASPARARGYVEG